MKLVSFGLKGDKEKRIRLGIMVEDAILDLPPAAALFLKEIEKEKNPYLLAEEALGGDMKSFLEKGRMAMSLARQTYKNFLRWRKEEVKPIRGLRREILTWPLTEIYLKAPILKPGKIIAMGLNFRDHAEENKMAIPEIPVGFLKVSSSVTGPYDPIPYPRSTTQLDYEVELCIVIGKKGKDIPQEKAYDHVAGYMIMNDLSARDIQGKEMEKRLLLLGKNFDGFAPLGPYLVTKEEIADVHNLEMELWVNNEPEPRQKSSTSQMIYKVPELIAYWSQMTLEPGDIITSGTPGGVAFFRRPDPALFFLKKGDVVKAKISGLGFLQNKIV